MTKKTTRHDGADAPALPSRRKAIVGTAATLASVAAVPAMAFVNPKLTAGQSEFAKAVAAWRPLEAESARLSGVLEAAYVRRKPYSDRHAEAYLHFKKVRDEARHRAATSPEHRQRADELYASHRGDFDALRAAGASEDDIISAAVELTSLVWDEDNARADASPEVLEAKRAAETAEAALEAFDAAESLDDMETAEERAASAAYDAFRRIACGKPGSPSEWFAKLDFLTVNFSGNGLDISDFLDLACDDLLPLLGLDYRQSAEAMEVDRQWCRRPEAVEGAAA
ncbi:MAG: hypothetical protein H7Y60_12825 [Rhodospirillaceae bacterium]|nr:hypothetical protein [Rhodospirillales bacterium]